MKNYAVRFTYFAIGITFIAVGTMANARADDVKRQGHNIVTAVVEIDAMNQILRFYGASDAGVLGRGSYAEAVQAAWEACAAKGLSKNACENSRLEFASESGSAARLGHNIQTAEISVKVADNHEKRFFGTTDNGQLGRGSTAQAIGQAWSQCEGAGLSAQMCRAAPLRIVDQKFEKAAAAPRRPPKLPQSWPLEIPPSQTA